MTSLAIAARPDLPEGWRQLATERGSFYHDPSWIEGIGRCYDFRMHYLTATMAGRLAGGLALAEVPALFAPRRLVSLPFSYAAGPIAESPEIAVRLAEAAVELAKARRISRVEIKQLGADVPAAPSLSRSLRYSTYIVRTADGRDAVFDRLHAASTRRSIRKGSRSGIDIVRGEDPAHWLAMAELEEETAHRLGLPAPPRRFFLELCPELQREGLADVYLARMPGGEWGAGITVWRGPRRWIYGFGASRPEHLASRPNHVLIWHAIERAIEAGVDFDLGRAAPEQEGLVEFKSRWGGEEVPLAYDYWPSASGLNVARRDSGALALAARVWRRLPAAVARRGAALYRYLG